MNFFKKVSIVLAEHAEHINNVARGMSRDPETHAALKDRAREILELATRANMISINTVAELPIFRDRL